MKKIGLLLALFSLVVSAAESDKNLAEKLATCTACHGPQGISINPQWPNLAGQHVHYLTKQLQDLKKGNARNVPVMASIMATIEEKDIPVLAAFYSKQPRAKGTVPE